MPRGGAKNTAREASDTRRRKSKGEKKRREEKRREGDGRDLVSGKSGGEKLARLNQQQGRQL